MFSKNRAAWADGWPPAGLPAGASIMALNSLRFATLASNQRWRNGLKLELRLFGQTALRIPKALTAAQDIRVTGVRTG